MKHNMNRVLSIVALLIIAISTWAGEVIIKSPTGGNVTKSVSGQTCTLTVTPADGNYLKSIKAVTTVAGSAIQAPIRRADTIEMGETELTITSDADADPSGETTHTFTMPEDGNLNVEVTAEFETRIDISNSNAIITLAETSFTYDGTEKKPAVSSVVVSGSTLNDNEFTVSYSNNTNVSAAATPTVTVTGLRKYTGTATKTFTISAKSIESDMITLTPSSFVYNGETPSFELTVNDGNTPLTEETDYTITYQVLDGETAKEVEEIIDAATYNVVITGNGNYTGFATKSFEITKAPLSLTISLDGWTYGETANTPAVEGNEGEGDETYYYKVKDADDETYAAYPGTQTLNAGEYTIKVEVPQTANYASGSATANFTITKAVLPVGGENGLKVTLAGWTYGATAKTPTVSGNLGNGEVTYTYSVAAENPQAQEFTATVPTDAGSYIVKATVAETANYNSGEATSTFTIAKADFSQVVISDIAEQTYTGSEITPAITVTFNNSAVDASEYTIGYSNNTNAGTATVTLTTTGKNFAAGQTDPSKDFTITGKSMTSDMITLTSSSLVYNGQTQKPGVTVMDGNTLLSAGTDFIISYQVLDGQTAVETDDTKDVATYNVVITGNGNYTGSASKSFEITKAQLTGLTVSLEGWTYGETANTPTVSGNTGGGTPTYYYKVKGADDETYAAYPDDQALDAGDYTIKVEVAETANYASGLATANFTIAQASLINLAVSLEGWTYGAQHAGPTVSGNLGNGNVTYTYKVNKQEVQEFTGAEPTDVGNYIVKATVAESDNYLGGEAQSTFAITKANITGLTVSENEGLVYDGTEQDLVTVSNVPSGATVKYYFKEIDEEDFENGSFNMICEPNDNDYTTYLPTSTNAGYFGIVYMVDGGNNYNKKEATATIKVAIYPAEITNVTLDNTSLTYTGEAQTVTITSVKAGTLDADDYTVTLNGEAVTGDIQATDVGEYTVGVTGIGNFTGTASATFTIVSRTLAVKDVTFNNHWSTFYSADEALELPEGIGAYVATGAGENSVTVTQIRNIPEKVAVLLNDETTTTSTAVFGTDVKANLLVHATSDKTVTAAEGDFYGLHNGRMKRVTGTIPAGKNYLLIPAAGAVNTGAPQLTIVIDGETTSIGDVRSKMEDVRGDVYDLQGRKVQKLSKKGLYLNNGRKVVVK